MFNLPQINATAAQVPHLDATAPGLVILAAILGAAVLASALSRF